MKTLQFTLFLISICLIFQACSDPEKPNPIPIPQGKGGILIVNEGNFMRGNAGLSLYRDGKLTDDVFSAVNKRPLGDVAQSVTLVGNRIYVIVNNSSKIEVIDSESFQMLGTISGLRSPRYMLPIRADKAYVTDLYANAISIIDPERMVITGKIPCHGWTEQLISVNNEVYVTNRYRPYVYVIDPETDSVKDSIKVSMNGNSILQGSDGQVWVLCGGKDGGLFAIDPQTKIVSRQAGFTSDSDEIPNRLTSNKSRDTLLFLNNGVFRFIVANRKIEENNVIRQHGKLFYGLGVNPENGDIYTADAIDFLQKGVVTRYRSDGYPLDSFRVGVIPSAFVFLP